ncbi:MAG: Cro/Cl family transcriptional regulator [Hyphomicrobiales bacterium]|nr:Cro/Cl family transcriptional regulator [Hyphomicrobiales bacterium]
MNDQPNPIDVEVGQRLRRRRVRLGITQKALGEALGVSFSQIQKYESGQNRIGASRMQELLTVLRVSPAYFFHEQSVGPSANSPMDSTVPSFASEQEKAQLLSAFDQVEDPHLRKRLLQLVGAVAGVETSSAKQR